MHWFDFSHFYLNNDLKQRYVDHSVTQNVYIGVTFHVFTKMMIQNTDIYMSIIYKWQINQWNMSSHKFTKSNEIQALKNCQMKHKLSLLLVWLCMILLKWWSKTQITVLHTIFALVWLFTFLLKQWSKTEICQSLCYTKCLH